MYSTVIGRYRLPAVAVLLVYGVVFRKGRPTPVHDHVTWGLIGVYSGEQRTSRYYRRDDGVVPGRGCPCAPGQDPLPRRLRRAVPDVREEPERGPART